MTNTHARVKNPDEKYGVKNTKWAEVYVFTVFGKVLSDHILPRMKNTHARVKNTKWAEVYVFTVVCKVLSDHILPRVKIHMPG